MLPLTLFSATALRSVTLCKLIIDKLNRFYTYNNRKEETLIYSTLGLLYKMATKPNWVCTNCRMWSGRKDSVKRHVKNQHGGSSSIVSYINYLVGRDSGLYTPSTPPTYQRKTMTDSLMDELYRESAREVVRHAFNWPNLINPPYKNSTIDQQPRPYYSFWTDIDNFSDWEPTYVQVASPSNRSNFAA
jgi:hypothetical protein